MRGIVSRAVRTGVSAMGDNLVPMVVLWSLAAVAVFGYYRVPAFAALLEPVADWQRDGGWAAAFLNRVAFCGMLPGLFLVSMKVIRPSRPCLTVFAYCLWAGLWGVACDRFFTFQVYLFGEGADLLTLFRKTLFDQLVWNVLICTPANAVFFPWVEGGFRRIRPREPFIERCTILLLSNWLVWLPVMAMVYAFPLPLQIQLVGLAGAFWMLVALRAAARFGEGK